MGRELPLRLSASGPPAPDERILPEAVFEEFGRAHKVFSATIELASAGYGQEAHVLAGIVLQSSLLTMWGLKQGEQCDHLADLHSRYLTHADREIRRRMGFWKTVHDEPVLAFAERGSVAA